MSEKEPTVKKMVGWVNKLRDGCGENDTGGDCYCHSCSVHHACGVMIQAIHKRLIEKPKEEDR